MTTYSSRNHFRNDILRERQQHQRAIVPLLSCKSVSILPCSCNFTAVFIATLLKIKHSAIIYIIMHH